MSDILYNGTKVIGLNTIQQEGKLNWVGYADEEGPGGGFHEYVITPLNSDALSQTQDETVISFQKGPRNGPDSTTGVCNVDLLEIVRHRLQSFMNGPLKSRETAIALTKIEEALMWLNQRTVDRKNRGVLGTMEK